MADVVHVTVPGKALTDMAREVVAAWVAVEPEEAARWRAAAIARRKLPHDNAWGKEVAFLPNMVVLMMGRLLNDPCWMEHDQHALQALCDVLPLARMTSGGLTCAADKNRVLH